MKRRIIQIDEDKCNGCGLCASACHEGAIAMVNGKAKLIRDDYCDGLGDCLPSCPTKAISFIEREAAPYDEEAVKKHMAERKMTFTSCKTMNMPISFNRNTQKSNDSLNTSIPLNNIPHNHKLESFNKTNPVLPKEEREKLCKNPSELYNWPIMIKLAPINAPYFNQARLLIAANCTAFSYANFHQEFLKNHIALIGCPKLDNVDYSEKLSEIIKQNDIKSITCVKMEVPCCGGLETAVKNAILKSQKILPWQVCTISRDGRIIDRT